MRYRSKPTEIEAMQWETDAEAISIAAAADRIVAWVKTNGGEARFKRSYVDSPCIAVRTINGWAYAAPGHYVVKGSATFWRHGGAPLDSREEQCLDFYPCDPETFETRWSPVSLEPATDPEPVKLYVHCAKCGISSTPIGVRECPRCGNTGTIHAGKDGEL